MSPQKKIKPMRTVCGLNVHKDIVFMCILNENKILFQDKFGILTPDFEQFNALHEYCADEVYMESTSIYWMPEGRVLEPYFSLKLVNPYFIKQLSSRKSDVKDMIRGSYVPEDRIQQLRQYNRSIFNLNRASTK